MLSEVPGLRGILWYPAVEKVEISSSMVIFGSFVADLLYQYVFLLQADQLYFRVRPGPCKSLKTEFLA